MKSLPRILLAGLPLLAACSKIPDHVVPPEQMAQVMADMYVARAVVDDNHMQYPTDSSRQVLKQSVLARHSLTTEQFDTSLVWYGHNAEVYGEVYDMTIAELERRGAELGAEAVRAVTNRGGDSTDVWVSSRYALISGRMPSRTVSFDIEADTSCRNGDTYTWRVKLVDNPHAEVLWNMYATYTDGMGETLHTRVTPSDEEGMWNQVTFATDSTRALSRLRGYFKVTDDVPSGEYWLDSISLVRKRLDAETYQQRYRLRSHREW